MRQCETYGISGEGRALEDVEEGTSVEGRLLVDGSDVGRLALGSGKEVTLDVELEAYLKSFECQSRYQINRSNRY